MINENRESIESLFVGYKEKIIESESRPAGLHLVRRRVATLRIGKRTDGRLGSVVEDERRRREERSSKVFLLLCLRAPSFRSNNHLTASTRSLPSL